jgi:hypothetical protein
VPFSPTWGIEGEIFQVLVPLRVAMIKANHPKMARSTRVDQGLCFSFFIMAILIIIPWPEVNQWRMLMRMIGSCGDQAILEGSKDQLVMGASSSVEQGTGRGRPLFGELSKEFLDERLPGQKVQAKINWAFHEDLNGHLHSHFFFSFVCF